MPVHFVPVGVVSGFTYLRCKYEKHDEVITHSRSYSCVIRMPEAS